MSAVCVVTEWPLREGWERDFLTRALLREGIAPNETTWLSLLESRPYSGFVLKAGDSALSAGKLKLRTELLSSGANVILCLGGYLTEFLTGHPSIDKWQASVLWSNEVSRKVIPCYSTERVARDLSLQLWVSLCCRKLAQEKHSPHLKEPKHDFLLNPPLEEALTFLRDKVSKAETVSFDIETGRGQINTIGFAISPREAIAINVLPDRLAGKTYYELWQVIREILESDCPKILQNFIYETLFLSRYGIRLNNVAHDTMIAQKFLWPEFEMGLDAVGRMYSQMPYWKDDGKSWNNIRDWEKHYEYNCKDTAGTFEGYLGQVADLRERGLLDIYRGYITRLFPAVAEMCSSGITVAPDCLSALLAQVKAESDDALSLLRSQSGAESFNPRSPAQVKAFLTSPPRKYSIPKKYDAKTKTSKESTDEKALKKLRMKYPADPALSALLSFRKLEKAQSSYLEPASRIPYADGRMRYSLTAGGTETMRFSGHCDPWDCGVNPQTVPGGNKGINIKSCFEAAPGCQLIEVDLRQAESRFVAYDAADPNLISALEDSSRDIHSEVAAEICRALGSDPTVEMKDKTTWKKRWRQLGKKSGHGANYSMKELTFIDSCIQEMDLVLSKTEATKVLEAYHTLFPGIRQWHARIRAEVAQTRTLRTPWGWERRFWGHMNDDLFRQAYAFRPQSTVPYIVNQLMLHLVESRRLGSFNFRLLLQCHDSLLLEAPATFVSVIAKECWATEHWHPKIILPGGRLVIPTEVKSGGNWGELEEIEPHSA